MIYLDRGNGIGIVRIADNQSLILRYFSSDRTVVVVAQESKNLIFFTLDEKDELVNSVIKGEEFKLQLLEIEESILMGMVSEVFHQYLSPGKLFPREFEELYLASPKKSTGKIIWNFLLSPFKLIFWLIKNIVNIIITIFILWILVSLVSSFDQKEILQVEEVTMRTLEQINKKNFNLKVLRNLPYAKRGYSFKSKDLREFYKSKKWYKENLSYQAKLSDLTNRETEWRNNVIKSKDIEKDYFLSLFYEYEEIFYYEHEKLPFEKKYAKKIFNILKLKNKRMEYLTVTPKNGTILEVRDYYSLKEISTYFKKDKKANKLLNNSVGVFIKFVEYSDGAIITFTFV